MLLENMEGPSLFPLEMLCVRVALPLAFRTLEMILEEFTMGAIQVASQGIACLETFQTD
jgi:hypothetical protein